MVTELDRESVSKVGHGLFVIELSKYIRALHYTLIATFVASIPTL